MYVLCFIPFCTRTVSNFRFLSLLIFVFVYSDVTESDGYENGATDTETVNDCDEGDVKEEEFAPDGCDTGSTDAEDIQIDVDEDEKKNDNSYNNKKMVQFATSENGVEIARNLRKGYFENVMVNGEFGPLLSVDLKCKVMDRLVLVHCKARILC